MKITVYKQSRTLLNDIQIKSGTTSRHAHQTRPGLILIFGILVGVSISILFFSMSANVYQSNDVSGYHRYRANPYTNDSHYLDNMMEEMNMDAALEHKMNHTNDDAHLSENTTVRDLLHKEVRVLCWVMTNPANHKTKAIHVKNTWGERCNKLLFMSTAEDEELGSIALNVSEGRDNLWAKTKAAFKYVYEHHFDEADWFYKADDDTYALMENMRYMLYPYSQDYPIYFGFKFKVIVRQGYMSGGAGYVLSKEALRRFVVDGLPDSKKCRQDNGGAEDAEMGKCLQDLDVIAGDSRDSQGRGRFFVFNPESHLFPSSDKSYWYWTNMFYNTTDGMSAMSDYAISFHYIGSHLMWAMEYMIYHLRPYGIVNNPQALPKKIALDEILRNGTVIMKEDIKIELEKQANVDMDSTTMNSTTSYND